MALGHANLFCVVPILLDVLNGCSLADWDINLSEHYALFWSIGSPTFKVGPSCRLEEWLTTVWYDDPWKI